MPSNCPDLKSLLGKVDGNEVPLDSRDQIENHLESCRTCRADFNQFLKIGNILQRTVYSNPAEDKYLAFIRHVAGRRLRWGRAPGVTEPPPERRRTLLLLLKVLAGFIGAAAVGASLAVILGHFGMLGRGGALPDSVDIDSLTAVELPVTDTGIPFVELQDTEPRQETVIFPLPDTLTPESVSEALALEEQKSSGDEKLSPTDSTRLRVLLAEQAALRDALSRSPGEASLIRRAVDKGREVIDERRRLGFAERVGDYYNLGYAHYLGNEYRQAVLVTTDGLANVLIGPTEYLHYLKAMSHYRLAQRMLQPLPADTSSTEQARLQGALLRSELDTEARTRAVGELRRSIAEFSHLLNRPELEPVARNWILEINERISAVLEP